MKRNHTLALLFILPLFLTFSCADDDDVSSPNAENPRPFGQMSATAGQSEFNTKGAKARYRTTGELTMTGTSADGRKFFFVIPGFSGPLDYTFGPGLGNSATYQQGINNTLTTFSTAVGTLSVTHFDETKQEISGTFSFTAAEVDNPVNTISITNGNFKDVPISSIPIAPEGAAVYYADDVYYNFRTPVLKETILRRVNMDIEIGGSNTYNVRFPAFFESGQDAGEYRVHLNSNFDYSVNPGLFTIHEYNEGEKWITATFKLLDRDFEMSLNKYPIQENNNLPGNGHIIMYTNTGSVTLQLWSIDFIENSGNLYGQAQMFDSNQGFEFSLEPGHASIEGSLNEHGEAVILFDAENSVITYWAFESDDESVSFAGENIPY